MDFILGDIKDLAADNIKVEFIKYLNQVFSSIDWKKELNTLKVNGLESTLKFMKIPSYLINLKSKSLNLNINQEKIKWNCIKELIKVHKRFKVKEWEWNAEALERDQMENFKYNHSDEAQKYKIWRTENKLFLEYGSNEEKQKVEIPSLNKLLNYHFSIWNNRYLLNHC